MIRNLFRENLSSQQDSPTDFSGGLTTNRLEAFSDGVFAIAITILVLTIAAPTTAEVHSADELLIKISELWPKLLSYIISFVVVGIYWVAHSATFHYIRRTNRPLFWLNLVYLMSVSFIPFPTALLGSFYQYQPAVVLYAATQVVTGTLFQVMVWYATYNNLIAGKLDVGFMRRATFRNLMGPVLYLLAILVSFVSLPVSLLFFVIVPILYILPGKIDRDWRRISPATAQSISPASLQTDQNKPQTQTQEKNKE
jgi:uncharacterized membrane protein